LVAALNTPSITLYGSTDSGLIGASGASQVHMRSDLDCSPCQKKTCRFTSGDNPCLKQIGPEKVFNELFNLLEKEEKRMPAVPPLWSRSAVTE
jgi:ADP-heptose:LPS heptosyltransferase